MKRMLTLAKPPDGVVESVVASGANARVEAGLHEMPQTLVVLAERAAGRRPDEGDGTPWDSAVLERATLEARTALREAASAAAEAAARALSVAEVLDEALAVLTAPEVAPFPRRSLLADGSARTERLSAREREVLALVAKGQTNKAIANALYVSPNTVKTHVTSLLHKLQADSRVQLAAIATKHGLQ